MLCVLQINRTKSTHTFTNLTPWQAWKIGEKNLSITIQIRLLDKYGKYDAGLV